MTSLHFRFLEGAAHFKSRPERRLFVQTQDAKNWISFQILVKEGCLCKAKQMGFSGRQAGKVIFKQPFVFKQGSILKFF